MEYNRLMLEDCKIGTKLRGYVLLEAVEEKPSKNGPYCELTISDGKSSAKGKVWKMTAENLGARRGDIVELEIETKDYMGRADHTLRPKNLPGPDCPFKISDFVRSAPLEPQYMYEEILAMLRRSVGGATENTLAELTEKIYTAHHEQLLKWGAAETVHHDMLGGLLYHTYRMMKQAEAMAAIYDSIDPELLSAAVALHDIGKLDEMHTDEFGLSTYNVDGRLFGHAVLGIEEVDRTAATGSYDEEKVRCLKHCIAAHHGNPEWGALSFPKILEASVLHYIDHLDGDLHQYEKAYAVTEPGEMSEKKVFGLNNVKVYRPLYK